MKTLIVTGGIGSGKSLVCSYLSEKGIPVYDADTRTKTLYVENPLIVKDIEDALGSVLTDDTGRLDRRRLGEIVFRQPDKLKMLEDIIHPLVFEDFIEWRNRMFEKNVPYVVMESAIFLEKPLFRSLANKVLLVEAPDDIRVSRVSERDSCSEENVGLRMKVQHYDKSLVDFVLVNDSDKETLRNRLDEILNVLWK